VNFTPRPARVVEESHAWRRSKLVDCELFRMDLLELEGERAMDTDGYAQVLTMLEGSGRLQAGAFEVSLQRGEAWLLPASLGDYLLSGRLRAVRATALS
jgi:mannose-6-phosphate isomerase class I